MSDNEKDLLIGAPGRANTALSLVRVVIQHLGERGLVPPEFLLEVLLQTLDLDDQGIWQRCFQAGTSKRPAISKRAVSAP